MLNPEVMNKLGNIREQEQKDDRKNTLQGIQN